MSKLAGSLRCIGEHPSVTEVSLRYLSMFVDIIVVNVSAALAVLLGVNLTVSYSSFAMIDPVSELAMNSMRFIFLII